ncbi:pirin family protein [Flavobacterium sp. J27]|uniref:pirin family protein n=1 Tax=Flavobacterium sp. J27 TaxID=2060419 RepID=UPI00103272D8|nr:pirin family protein [Flavobacterium sp. J27]
MIEIIKKSQQYNEIIFNNKFFGNKPVSTEQKNIKPYSNLFYWNHGFAKESIEFPLHPHQGFEIMTFVLEGRQEHFDTLTKKWIPLNKGDFQIIKSNSGIYHAEKLDAGTSGFQIWFDPNFKLSLNQPPSYKDYKSSDFRAKIINGIKTITYIGDGSEVETLTPNIAIKKFIFEKKSKEIIFLKKEKSYTFYMVEGEGMIQNNFIEKDDAIRISGADNIEFEFIGVLFCVEANTIQEYKTFC